MAAPTSQPDRYQNKFGIHTMAATFARTWAAAVFRTLASAATAVKDRFRFRCIPKRLRSVACLTTLWLLANLLGPGTSRLLAGEVRLKNGMVIEGKPVPIQSLTAAVQRNSTEITTYPIVMIDTGMQRYFVPARQVVEENRDVELSRFETFQLDQRKTSGRLKFESIGSFLQTAPFDAFGRRRVTLQTPRGPMEVLQGITQIHPWHTTVTGLNCTWEYAIATTSIPTDSLDQMIRNVTDQTNPDDRLSIASFYLQAGMYVEAQRELDAIVTDFPELAERVKELTSQVRDLLAKQLLGELRHRQNAGQHFLAYTAARQFPTQQVSVEVRGEVRELIDEYDGAREKITRSLSLLGELQSQVKEKRHVEAIAPLRSEVVEELSHETLSRLDAFLKLETDTTLSAEEKLALAYSGWVLGSANAITDLNTTIRLWDARFYVMQYLRSKDEETRTRILADLHNLEGVGFTNVLQLIPLLPLVYETPGLRSGEIISIQVPDIPSVAGADSLSVNYSVLLPQEYHPHHRYPAIVALRSGGESIDRFLRWWGGAANQPLQSQRRGYIVIAPDYAAPSARDYDYGATAHYIILQSIRDARKRFRIDSDRVFLAGQGMGADAAFDVGMSHLDLFAGVIATTGVIGGYCPYYWQNAKDVPWYVVSGERDGDKFDRNAFDLNRMLRYGFDIILTEYIGRGPERYYAEIHKLFDWMDLHTRPRLSKEVDVRILRPTDNRHAWVKVDGLPDSVARSAPPSEPAKRSRTVRPMILEARVAPGDTDRNAIQIRSGADKTVIWLNPDLIDFDKRVTVRINGRYRSNGFIRPDLQVLLDDLRIRGDRRRLFWARLDFD